MKKIAAAVIGCGNIFPIHADSIINYSDGKLVSVVDIDDMKAREAAQKYDCDYCTDYRLLLDDSRINVVHIAVPHYLHYKIASELLRAGKNVILEKPVALNLKEAEKLERESYSTDKHISVVLQNRFNSTSRKAKDILEKGILGEIKGIKGILTWYRNSEYYLKDHWRGRWSTEGGGLLINQAIHTLDLMQWFGGEVEAVKGHIDTRCLGDVIEVEDTAEATMYFKNGAVGMFYGTNCYTANDSPEIKIHCEKGSLVIREGELWISEGKDRKLITADKTSSGEKSYWGNSHEEFIHNFYDCILGNKREYITISEGKKSLQIVEGIYWSSRNDKIVELR